MTLAWSSTESDLRTAAGTARPSDAGPALAIADALAAAGARYDAAVSAGLWIDDGPAFAALCTAAGVDASPPSGWEAAHPGELWQPVIRSQAGDLAVTLRRVEGLARAAVDLAAVLATLPTATALPTFPSAPSTTPTLTALRAGSVWGATMGYALAVVRAAEGLAFSRDLTRPEHVARREGIARVHARIRDLNDRALYPGESSDAELRRALDAATAELEYLARRAA